MNLIETNQQINMTLDHSFSSNNLFKCLLNASSCAAAVARVTWRHEGDVNSVLGENPHRQLYQQKNNLKVIVMKILLMQTKLVSNVRK